MRTTPPARLATQWHCWLLVHSFLGFPGVGCFQFSIGITSLRGCLKSEAMKSEKMFQITVFFCLCYSHLQVSSLLLLNLYWNPQQFAPDFSSHCSIKHRELSGAEWHGKSISYLKSLIELRTLEWLCLAELCLRGWAVQTCHSTGKRRGSILCRDFETDQTNVFFFFFLLPTILSSAGHIVSHLTLTSTESIFSFLQVVCVCLCRCGCSQNCLHIVQLYVCTHF